FQVVSADVGALLYFLVPMFLFSAVVLWNAAALDRLDGQRSRAEADLQASERRFRALIENSADAVTLVAADGTLRYASPSTARVLGYSPDELLGDSVILRVHTE